ncbi:MAG: hypothetical protein EA353_09470 [Puniceicoccaceae bacterium]|nr:MAG: hypothetical protein EA353_09470 [Puniceicoccaceae bacterium]
MMPQDNPHEPIYRRLAVGFLLLCMGMGLFTTGHYGMTWDEPFRFAGGDSKLDYYKGLLSGETPDRQTSSYPGLFDLPLALFHEQFPNLGTRSQKGHVYSFLFGMLGILSAWRLTARLGGERAGLWALLFLATLPRYYGHMFFNPKDIPLAGTYIFGLWALVACFSRLPSVPWKYVVWIGVAGGLSMSTRIAGFLIFCYFGLFALIYVAAKYGVNLRSGQSVRSLPWLSDIKLWVLRGFAAGAIGFSILFLFWPTVHRNPFSGASQALETVQSYSWSGVVLMDGHFWEASNLPFYYIPYWIVYTTPEHILLLLALGMALGVITVVSYGRSGLWPSACKWIPRSLIVFAWIFPLGYMLWKDPVIYDGLRHFLFVLPPMVCVAALGFEWILRQIERAGRPRFIVVLQAVMALAAGLVTIEMVRLHPYQYVYFNQISGGLPGAFGRDETDYWGLSHKEAAEWLNAHVEEIDPGGERIFRVHQLYSFWMLQEHLNSSRFEVTAEPEGADFFVSMTRFNFHNSYPEADLLHAVERKGIPLCFIFSLAE